MMLSSSSSETTTKRDTCDTRVAASKVPLLLLVSLPRVQLSSSRSVARGAFSSRLRVCNGLAIQSEFLFFLFSLFLFFSFFLILTRLLQYVSLDR